MIELLKDENLIAGDGFDSTVHLLEGKIVKNYERLLFTVQHKGFDLKDIKQILESYIKHTEEAANIDFETQYAGHNNQYNIQLKVIPQGTLLIEEETPLIIGQEYIEGDPLLHNERKIFIDLKGDINDYINKQEQLLYKAFNTPFELSEWNIKPSISERKNIVLTVTDLASSIKETYLYPEQVIDRNPNF